MEALTAESMLFNVQALSREDQYQIHTLMTDKQTVTQVAQDLGRISREVKLGRGDRGYLAGRACPKATEHAQRSRHARHLPSWVGPKVVFYFRCQYSPEQIEQKPQLNHESVYMHKYADRAKGGRLHKDLRTQKLRRRRCLTVHDRCGEIPHRLKISENLMHVDTSKQVGQWLDFTFIVVDHQQAIVTMVGRKIGYATLCKAPNNRADLVSQAIRHRVKPLGACVKTLTVDNGKEFAYHRQLDQTQDIQTYFDNSYCILERDSNENLNGLLRQYISNIQCMGEITQNELTMIENRHNQRLIKRLPFKSPQEVFHTSLNRFATRL